MNRFRVILMCMASAAGVWFPVSVSAQLFMSQQSSGRECAMCHLDWVQISRKAGALPFIVAAPRDIVNDPDTCLGCHDGSVADSRRQVWLEHGHQSGIAPPEGMTIPKALPLVDGKLACSTCHTSHTVPPKDRDPTLADVFFLRMPNDKGQLCMSCHTDRSGGPEHGSHPVNVTLKGAWPEALRDAGAKVIDNGDGTHGLSCASCHLPHGSKEDALLALSTGTNAFCLSCHESMSSQRGEGHKHLHPNATKLESKAQREAIHTMGTRLGDRDRMVCSSCHKMHASKEKYLLAETLEAGQLCVQCHQKRSSVLGTPHDLATIAPEAKNAKGHTVADSGVCSACHGIHAPARDFQATSLDPTGLCATCHQSGQCAEKTPLLSNDHPMRTSGKKRITCHTCHDPHANTHANFLRQEPDQLCNKCHEGKVKSLAGAHDFSDLKEARNAAGHSPQETGKCSFCHAIHNARGPSLWAANENAPKTPNELCINCHLAGNNKAHNTPTSLRHPTGTGVDLSSIPKDHWPLYDAKAHTSPEGVMTCSTCHDVHGDSTKSKKLLRRTGPAQQGGATWCTDCHRNTADLVKSMHRDQELVALIERMKLPNQTTYCGPCHQVHASETPVEQGMWSGPISGMDLPHDMQSCVGCHSGTDRATAIHITQHPVVPMQNNVAADAPGYLPLVDEKGQLGDSGNITCQTCHLPHGRSTGGGYPEVNPETMPSKELAGLGSLVRPYVSTNLCGECHGLEGLGYYLYYHFPEKRAKLNP